MAKKKDKERRIRGPFKNVRRKLNEIKKKNAILAFFIDTAVILVSALVISFVIKTFFLRSFYIPSG